MSNHVDKVARAVLCTTASRNKIPKRAKQTVVAVLSGGP